ncbi:5-formyltetrahydrofolate cyclo-ligase [Demequina sp. TTPB684]|uniref:5-formyltetrahydrofolate cyclo-ligase n=1 Tax=unclassified Demequina TaxID=2620311 RepID=UPI001CF142AA|nr:MULTISPECIES: 5-formyltetrahydrofolate cyclo-ligase [unclassified Demequina]MCB2412429.1 5-formyltetrahydrofolate cyclo-ligase [Demequina sp. TTPB684]UPU87415.1 5-formyltetrahydrofolate cyclo-ligase [Demequina sp. TMPB413]
MTPLSHIDTRTMPPAEAKSAWRSAVRQGRLQRGERRMVEHAESFRDHVLALPEIEGITCVSIYASRNHEPGTLPLITALHERGVEVLMPRLGDGLVRGWGVFSSADDIAERAPGRPPEPSGEFLPATRLADAQLIVVPALGVDSLGTRLGQGAGWYDRALADATPGVPIVALVFDDEFYDAEVRALPRERHDVPVTIVVTPSTVARIPA